MAAVELRDNQWRDFIKSEYAIIDCYGYNCTACVMLEPVYNAVADELCGISFGRINISEYPDIAEKYSISAMPTVLLFRSGELAEQFIGSMDRDGLLELIAKLLYQ